MADHIKIKNIALTASLSDSPWPSLNTLSNPSSSSSSSSNALAVSVSQPIYVSLDITHDLRKAATSDDLSHSIDYSELSKLVQRICQGPTPVVPTAHGLAQCLLSEVFTFVTQTRNHPITALAISVVLPKAVLRANNASVHVSKLNHSLDLDLNHTPEEDRDKDEMEKEKGDSKSGRERGGRVRFRIEGLTVHTIVGINPQERLNKQPVVLDLNFVHNPSPTASSSLPPSYKFPFAQVEDCICDFVEKSSYLTVEALASEVIKQCYLYLCLCPNTNADIANFEISIDLAKPAAIRHAEAPVISLARTFADFPELESEVIRQTETGVVSIRKDEARESQHSNSRLDPNPSSSSITAEPKPEPRKGKRKKVVAALALGSNLGDRFQNIERALRHLESLHTLGLDLELPGHPPLPHLSKSSDSIGVNDNANANANVKANAETVQTGDREGPVDDDSDDVNVKGNDGEMEEVVSELEVVATSFMYETAPMYVTDQHPFLNCACLIKTTLPARTLLTICKTIETAIGRVPTIRFGPRAIDLDIITYGSASIDTRPEDRRTYAEGDLGLEVLEGRLVVPHPRMGEREFVLRPLCDIIPEWVHPRLGLSVRSLLEKVVSSRRPDDPPMYKVIPFPVPPSPSPSNLSQPSTSSILDPNDVPATQTYWKLPSSPDTSTPSQSHSKTIKKHTYIMATLNATPDSFSDGSLHSSPSLALPYIHHAIASGASIIDIGGYSTRPSAHATPVSPAEETSRILPIIRAIREDRDERVRGVLISVDTFRPEVARVAVEEGANCVNDVCACTGMGWPLTEGGGEGEGERIRREMVGLARRTGVPVIMMHSRGDAGSNKDYSSYNNNINPTRNGNGNGTEKGRGQSAVLRGVQLELGAKVRRVLGKYGLRRWQVIVDPGIGFSKSGEDNLELLRCAREITAPTIIDFEGLGLGLYGHDYGYGYASGSGSGSGKEGRTSISASTSADADASVSGADVDADADESYTTPGLNPLAGFPILIGPSRKSFLGTIIAEPLPQTAETPSSSVSPESERPERPAKDRDFATAAAVACAVREGADVVRVHAVQEMVDVVKVASALWA